MRFLYKILGITILLSLVTCKNNIPKNKNIPVARVFDKYLYTSDLTGLVNQETSSKDSAQIIKNYIDKWIKEQLVLQKAELNLSPEQKDVNHQLEDYRASLLIFKYEQQWIKQNLDTSVSDKEIKDYYNSYSSNFLLQENIVKAIYIKIPKTASDVEKIRSLYRSNKEEDSKILEGLCIEYAKTYDTFKSDWVMLNFILKELPHTISDQEEFLKNHKYYETEDDNYFYFLNIKEYKLKNEISPLTIATDNIKQILLNKRRFNLIKQLENNIYNDALNYGHFDIFNKKK